MTNFLTWLKKLFNYYHKKSIKFFASKELDNINYEIRNLESRRDHLEFIVFGN